MKKKSAMRAPEIAPRKRSGLLLHRPNDHPLSQSFSGEGRKDGRTGGSCKSKPNGHYSLPLPHSSLSKSRKEERRSGAVGQRFIRHCRQVRAGAEQRAREDKGSRLAPPPPSRPFLNPKPCFTGRKPVAVSLPPSFLLFLRCSF